MELHLDAVIPGVIGNRALIREQGHRLLLLLFFIEDLDAPSSCLFLGVIDFAEIKDVSIDQPSVGAPAFLGNAPITMFLTVLEVLVAFHELDGSRL